MSINASSTLPLLVSRTQVLSNTVRPRARPRAGGWPAAGPRPRARGYPPGVWGVPLDFPPLFMTTKELRLWWFTEYYFLSRKIIFWCF